MAYRAETDETPLGRKETEVVEVRMLIRDTVINVNIQETCEVIGTRHNALSKTME